MGPPLQGRLFRLNWISRFSVTVNPSQPTAMTLQMHEEGGEAIYKELSGVHFLKWYMWKRLLFALLVMQMCYLCFAEQG